MTRRLLFAAAACAAATAATLGGVLGGSPPPGSASEPPAALSAARLLDGAAPGDTEATVERLERRVDASPDDAEGLLLLGLAYHRLSRETGDPGLYPRAERALRRSLGLAPGNDLALTGLAAVAASRHQFVEARRLARRALALNPYSAAALGIVGDAEIETGRYRQAFAAFDRMAALKPTASAYARVSYARELLGRTEAAIDAMELAVSAAAASPEPAAWARVQLGNLYAQSGRLSRARSEYRRALAGFPGYAPALGGLATLELWLGRAERAAVLNRRALEAQPLPEYAVALGDALAAAELPGAADGAYARAGDLERLFARFGGRNDLETALFDLDHGRNLASALSRARCAEARTHSVRALRLGTKDWGAMLHRSLIESCRGDERAAEAWKRRALEANPYALAAFGPLEPHRR
jgi:tetratricopeptide (TPR) repeat protein